MTSVMLKHGFYSFDTWAQRGRRPPPALNSMGPHKLPLTGLLTLGALVMTVAMTWHPWRHAFVHNLPPGGRARRHLAFNVTPDCCFFLFQGKLSQKPVSTVMAATFCVRTRCCAHASLLHQGSQLLTGKNKWLGGVLGLDDSIYCAWTRRA